MREQLAKLIENHEGTSWGCADQILTLFREEISKLKPLSDERIGDNLDLDSEATYLCSDGSSIMTIFVNKLLEAQLDDIRKRLMEVME